MPGGGCQGQRFQSGRKAGGGRCTFKRLKVPSSFGAPAGGAGLAVALSLSASAVRLRPLRPSGDWRAPGSLRKNAAACGSCMPKRVNRVSAVSLVRVWPGAVQREGGGSSASALAARLSGNAVFHRNCTGRSAASGLKLQGKTSRPDAAEEKGRHRKPSTGVGGGCTPPQRGFGNCQWRSKPRVLQVGVSVVVCLHD